MLKIRNPKNDKEVIVEVTDRGPHKRSVLIDLSFSAAKELGIIQQGIAQVEIIKLDSVTEPEMDFNEEYTTLYKRH